MRISDILMSNNFLSSIQRSKSAMEKLQRQIANQTLITRPSDSPVGITKILRYADKLSQSDTYANNIQNGLAFLKETNFALENIQSEIMKVMTNLTALNNPANNQDLNSFADQIELSMKAILDYANTQYDGKYLFGGTDFAGVPFGYSSDQSSIEVKVSNISGKHFVKISPNTTQKINLTGLEVFGTVVSQRGNLDLNSAVGSVSNNTIELFGADGTAYNLNLSYTKTAVNTYSLSYDIIDGNGNSIYTASPSPVSITFDSATGRIKSVDGKENFLFNIKNSDHKIDFTLDLGLLKESNAATSLSVTRNQDIDIFNSLNNIVQNLRNGILPTQQEQAAINNFNKKFLDRITENGNITNQLYAAEELLANQRIITEELLSKEQDVDVVKAIMELQNYDYLLQLSYKMSAMFLPKSLLDYL